MVLNQNVGWSKPGAERLKDRFEHASLIEATLLSVERHPEETGIWLIEAQVAQGVAYRFASADDIALRVGQTFTAKIADGPDVQDPDNGQAVQTCFLQGVKAKNAALPNNHTCVDAAYVTKQYLTDDVAEPRHIMTL